MLSGKGVQCLSTLEELFGFYTEISVQEIMQRQETSWMRFCTCALFRKSRRITCQDSNRKGEMCFFVSAGSSTYSGKTDGKYSKIL